MPIKTCKYTDKNLANCISDEKLKNIPQLPWAHKECPVDNSNCELGQNRPFSNFRIVKWKNTGTYHSIIPTNSRPLPQLRRWCAPGRPLPQLSDDPNCNIDSSMCNLYSTNGGYIDPITGNYINEVTHSQINENDYLLYNNPDLYINGVKYNNFYSGPGWKQSRVYGSTKTRALPRPIKHWRKQLFPRQFVDYQTGIPINQNSTIQSIEANTRGRKYTNLLDAPGTYFKTTDDLINSQNNYNISCIPIYVNDNSDILISNCLQLNKNTGNINSCIQTKNLITARPGSLYQTSSFVFDSNKGYLQARGRLSYQVSTFSYNPNFTTQPVNLKNNQFRNNITIPPNTFPPSTISLYRNNKLVYYSNEGEKLCYTTDCSCAVAVSFKPRNVSFQRDSAVSSGSNTRRKARISKTRNQYNITNKWGIKSGGDSVFTNCLYHRVTPRGSINCQYNQKIQNIIQIPPPNSDWSFMFLNGQINPNGANYQFFVDRNLQNNSLNQDLIDILTPFTYIATNMEGMFQNATLFNSNLNSWNVSNVTNMSRMFFGARNFNSQLDNWNTGNVTDMSNMFKRATNFNQDIGGWDTGNVTNMSSMFEGIGDVINRNQFNKNIGNWNVVNVTNMSRMFSKCLFNQNLYTWNTSKVTNLYYMFHRSLFNQPINTQSVTVNGNTYIAWDVSKVTNMSGTFYCNFFDQDIGNWDTSSVTDMSEMFRTSNFNKPINTSTVTVGGNTYTAWDVSEVTNMSEMFISAPLFNQNINNWNVSNVTDMTNMFRLAFEFNENIFNWNTSKVTSMASMFANAKKFNKPITTQQVTVNGNTYTAWDTSEVTDMDGMFLETDFFNQDIVNWNTSKVTNMALMFTNAKKFNQDISTKNVIVGLNNYTAWDVSIVTNMQGMFDGALLFNQDSIKNWDVSSISTLITTYFDRMFIDSGMINIDWSSELSLSFRDKLNELIGLGGTIESFFTNGDDYDEIDDTGEWPKINF